ncbi:MAG: hypothetical protein Q9216_004477 [Gyalolechia sp. 2 TL-2023]
MNARNFCNLSLQHQKGPIATTLLPFLYQTRTIQSPPAWPHRARRFVHPSPRAYTDRGVASEAIPFEDDQRKRSSRFVKASADAIPFEGDTAHQQLDNTNFYAVGGSQNPFTQWSGESSARPPRASTITASEQAVFDRIFKEISADASKKAAEEEEDPFDDEFEADAASQGDAYADLGAIFDDALQTLKQKDKVRIGVQMGRIQSDVSSTGYMTAITPAISPDTRFLKMSEIRGDENFNRIRKSVKEHKHKVSAMLDEARTDVEIWKVLDTEVFPLIHQYDTLRKEVEEQKTAKKPKRKKARRSRSDQEAAEAAEQKESLRAAEKSAQEAEVQAILSSNYGDYCLAAMRRLRRAFPMSPYCINMLPTIKRLGPISHVLAASVELYNEILFLQWKEYSDLHGMADLVFEMGNQGIESNEVTLKVLTMVQYARRTAITESRTMKLWWNLRSVDTGWQKIRSAAKKVRYEIVQARSRRSLEERQARSGVDGEGSLPGGEDLQEEIRTENEMGANGALADEAVILEGGLGSSANPRAEV